jgi:IclR family pca regulon transcriptional regulator
MEGSMPRALRRSAAGSGDRELSSVPANPSQVSSIALAQIDFLSGDPNFMTSLARGLAVVQAFSSRKRQMTMSQLSSRTGFSRAAVRRCLYTLMKLGFAGTDDSHHFYLCPRILSLGHSYISSMPLSSAVQPVLKQMSHQLLESCSIATLDGVEVIFVARTRARATRTMSIDIRVGSRLPAFCTAMGRVLLANLPAEEQKSCIAHVQFSHYTDRTVRNAVRLREILRLVRREGFCMLDQELEVGVRAMAVPIHHPAGGVAAALNVAALAQRVSGEEMQKRFLERLRDTAQELSRLIEMSSV